MGVTLSKLWAAIRGALTGGAPAGTNSQQQHHQDTITIAKDVESASHSPTTTTEATMPEVKKWEITEPWLRMNCSLGEGPFWEDDTNTLRFLDVEKCKVHRVDLNVGQSSLKVIKDFDISIGCTADIEGNPSEFAFAGKYGYGIANKQTGEYRWIKKVWSEDEIKAGKHEKYRGNDGAVDSQGRFWAGFMFDPLVSDWDEHGALFRLNTDGSLDRPLSDIAIPNGTTWNKDDNKMYWADSPTKTIFQFDYDPKTGEITNRRPFFTMPEDNRYGKDAVPDGHCIDEEGFMWTALHGGSHVLKISPEGEIVGEIKVPTSQPTCPCFCGEDLVITSAGGTSGEGGKGVDEVAGSVFKINVGVRGLKRFKYKSGA
ncbi:hypothetical protein HBI83_120190 [Parastagonospora nodorum]|nr:hypothetical protein HBI83_120190 [Parastagonospora nodorum]